MMLNCCLCFLFVDVDVDVEFCGGGSEEFGIALIYVKVQSAL